MNDLWLAEKYAPIVHFERGETIPLRRVGYSVFREEARSDSFPKRTVAPGLCGLVIEYAFYWDFDVQHMYDLEHIWVWVAADGRVTRAEGSFHGKFLTLWEPEMPFALAMDATHVHAFCQPGKHAFLPEGRLFRLAPGWRESCNAQSGGAVLVGGPFHGLYQATPEEDERCARYIREHFAFEPTLYFDRGAALSEELLRPWEALKVWIPARISQLLGELI